MNISGRVLREVEFRDRLRGYDTDEVDEFLEKVAVAIDEAETELVELKRRAEAAEARASEAAASAASKKADELPALDDDGIRRTLVLAQRTADLAVREAREEAERLVESARSQAELLLNDADERAQRLREEAEQQFEERMGRTNEQHEALLREIGLLEQVLDGERDRLTLALTSALRFVGDAFQLSDQAAEHGRIAGRAGADGAGDAATGRAEPHDPRAASPGSGAAGEAGPSSDRPDVSPGPETMARSVGTEADLEVSPRDGASDAFDGSVRDLDGIDPGDSSPRSAHPAAGHVGRGPVHADRADDLGSGDRSTVDAGAAGDAIRSIDWRAETEIDLDDIELQLERDAAAAHVTAPWEGHVPTAERRPRLTVAGEERDEELWARWAAGSEAGSGDFSLDAGGGHVGAEQERAAGGRGGAGDDADVSGRASSGDDAGGSGSGGDDGSGSGGDDSSGSGGDDSGGGGIFRLDRRRGGH